MKKFLLTLCLLIVAGPAFAQETFSGLFFDPERDGEGVLLFEQAGIIQFNFFTCIERCRRRNYEDEGLILEGVKGYDFCRPQQAWYITGTHPLVSGQAIGPLYTSVPYNQDEDVDALLADVVDVGLFVLTQTATGFDMIVLQTGNALDEDADIYHRTYHFTSYLFGPSPKNPIGDEFPEE